MPTDKLVRHVYIFGAGASMPLGGPSFNQLLSDSVLVRHALQGINLPNRLDFVASLHTCIPGLYKLFGIEGDRDVEQVLERLDYCEANPSNAIAKEVFRLLSITGEKWIDRELEIINDFFRLRLAIDTREFLTQIPDDSERFEPYKRWFVSLSSEDAILTFNYDPVVEKVAELVGRGYLPPQINPPPTVQCLVNPSDDLPPLLKLHGSTDWIVRKASGLVEDLLKVPIVRKIHWPDLIARGESVLLGSPGLSKKKLSQGLFKPIWDEAERLLREAEEISIVGYSMPATDNLAKNLILDSIAKNSRLKRVNIVLGPSSDSVVARRLEDILMQSLPDPPSTVTESLRRTPEDSLLLRKRMIKRWAMYAQDFLPLSCGENLAQSIVPK